MTIADLVLVLLLVDDRYKSVSLNHPAYSMKIYWSINNHFHATRHAACNVLLDDKYAGSEIAVFVFIH